MRLTVYSVIKTYIINAARGKASSFHLDDEICGFSCGLFTVRAGKTLPVLVYATFTGSVHLYYDLCHFQGEIPGNQTKELFPKLFPSFYRTEAKERPGDFQRRQRLGHFKVIVPPPSLTDIIKDVVIFAALSLRSRR